MQLGKKNEGRKEKMEERKEDSKGGREEIQTGKEEAKLSQFADNMMLYIENLKEYTHINTQLELINVLNKVAGYEVNMEKSIVFLLEKTIWFAISNLKMKLRKPLYLQQHQKV